MFDGKGILQMADDHVRCNFADPAGWLTLTPTESIRAAMFLFGDVESGPSVSLARVTPVPGEQLDWQHQVDPVHHHGTDQFRLILGGEWNVGRSPLSVGDFCFQEAGRVYQEHPGPAGGWMLLIYGDRRGEPATIVRAEERAGLAGEQELYGASLADSVYPHPAGAKGIPAIASTIGPTHRGYLAASFAETTDWVPTAYGTHLFAGLWGDAVTGPVVYLLHAAPGQTIVPAAKCDAEIVYAVSGGSCHVGPEEYATGEIRIQRAGAPAGDIRAGEAGARIAVVVGDRRSGFQVLDRTDRAAVAWGAHLGTTVAGLLGRLP